MEIIKDNLYVAVAAAAAHCFIKRTFISGSKNKTKMYFKCLRVHE